MKTRARAVAASALFFAAAPAVVAGWIPYALTRWRFEPPFGHEVTRLLGGVGAAAGLLVLLDCFRRFAVEGLGTPAPVAPTEHLVVTGLYRHVRNPMYVAIMIILCGQAVLLGSWTLVRYAALVWLLFHLWVLLYEEPALTRRFGDSYRAYRAGVRRWRPRLTPWLGPPDA
jgi:protein-S-isoprenylcysteine O-methyltransferase Ste14